MSPDSHVTWLSCLITIISPDFHASMTNSILLGQCTVLTIYTIYTAVYVQLPNFWTLFVQLSNGWTVHSQLFNDWTAFFQQSKGRKMFDQQSIVKTIYILTVRWLDIVCTTVWSFKRIPSWPKIWQFLLNCPRIVKCMSNSPLLRQCMSNCPMVGQCIPNCPMVGQCLSNCPRVLKCLLYPKEIEYKFMQMLHLTIHFFQTMATEGGCQAVSSWECETDTAWWAWSDVRIVEDL